MYTQSPVDPANPDWSCGWSIDAGRMGEAIMDDMVIVKTGAAEKRAGMKRWLSALRSNVVPISTSAQSHNRINRHFKTTFQLRTNS